MKCTKQITALLTAVLLACSLTACGGDNSSGGDAKSNVSTADSVQGDESSGDSADESRSGDSSEADDSSQADDPADDSSVPADESSQADPADSQQSGSSGGNQGSSGGNSGSSSSKTDSSKADNSKSDSSKTDNSSQGGSAQSSADDSSDSDAQKPTKYIYLQDTTAQYSGDGIYVSGGKITISKGGNYEISGTLTNGQIYIMTDKKKVQLYLNNANITNKAGSAINIQSAKKVTISTLAGTTNTLTDGGTHDADKGTIFSEDTVILDGEGVLNIKANYAHGVQSDDDIIVNGGKINITSTKSGLHSNDGIEINGGTLFCDGGTNGIKTDGYVTITGGSSVFLGGTREEKGAIYCDGSFTVTGGNFWAIGNTCATPDAATTTTNVIGIMFANTQAANSVVNVTTGNNTIYTMTSPRSYKYVVYAGPNLQRNATYNVSYGGTVSGGTTTNYVTTGGSYSGGTSGGSFTAGNPVTFHTVQ